MSGISLFCQDLRSFPASRAKTLHASMLAAGLPGIDCVYALVWPETHYQPPVENLPRLNRASFAQWRRDAALPLWAWFNCNEDQAADGWVLIEQDDDLSPDGWLLDIEGSWTKGAKLGTICEAASLTSKPVRASLAAMTASHVDYDYRTLDRLGIAVDWQAYFDSGEGTTPAIAVSELHRSSFVIASWEYRHRLGSVYGWGKVTRIEQNQLAVFDSFKRPGFSDGNFTVGPREWGNTVVDGTLRRGTETVGLVMGRAAYSNVRVTLDVTRTAQSRHPSEWVAIAASARAPGARKRPISVYLADVAADDVLMAIAQGAA